ncbi:MAG TPA: TlpA disulfide reductase family protein [Candidatus Paceibacterota bacterium]|nr:TlpA disulfide reductase family protein [Candidatus Paceibacterota bacterium]
MREYVRGHVGFIAAIVATVAVLGFLTYSFVAPSGMFSGLQNDLKALDEGDGGTYTDLDGNPVPLSRFKGKPLIVNLWASWMPFSKDELSLMSALASERGESVAVVAVNRMEDPATVRSYLATFGLGQGITVLLDPADSFYKKVGGYAMPETLFYAKDGTLVEHKRGVLTEAELKAYVDSVAR